MGKSVHSIGWQWSLPLFTVTKEYIISQLQMYHIILLSEWMVLSSRESRWIFKIFEMILKFEKKQYAVKWRDQAH